MHVHLRHDSGRAKIWLEPRIELAHTRGLSQRRVAMALQLVREREDEIRSAWQAHLGR